MIFFALLLSADPSIGEARLQQRVDKLMSTCKALDVMALDAESDGQVIMQMRKIGDAPSKSDSDKFDCVLKGMKAMPDISFGFLGNAPPEPEAK